MENIQKPITIVRSEFITNMTNLINGSMLPPFIIEPILRDMYNDIHILAQKQYENDVQEYQKALSEMNQENDKEK